MHLQNKLSVKNIFHVGILPGAMLITFVLAFIFNAYLGRVLSFSDYGVVTFIGALWLIIGVFCNALSLTINKVVITTTKSDGYAKGIALFRHIRKTSLKAAIACFVIVSLLSYPISQAFSLNSALSVVLTATLIVTGILAAGNRGYMQSKFHFGSVGVTFVGESVVKLLLAFLIIVFLPWKYVYISIPLAALFAYVLSEYLLPKNVTGKNEYSLKFPKHFYLASVLAALSTMLLLTSDVILAKLFLSPQIAGQYSFLSLIGKMIYFCGSLLNMLMVPYISERISQGKDDLELFYQFIFVNGFIILSSFLVIGIFGGITLPFFLGEKVYQVSQYLLSYSAAIALMTFSNIIVVYHLLHHRYIFPFVALLISVLIITTMLFFHANIAVMVQVLFSYSIVLFIAILYLHVNQHARTSLEVRMPFLQAAYEK